MTGPDSRDPTDPEETRWETPPAAEAAEIEAQRDQDTHFETEEQRIAAQRMVATGIESPTGETTQAATEALAAQYRAEPDVSIETMLERMTHPDQPGEVHPDPTIRGAAFTVMMELRQQEEDRLNSERSASAAAESVQNLDAFGRPLSDIPEGAEPEQAK